MASETTRKAERVFCQHVLKPLPDEPGAYRCQRCGAVGDMQHRSIVWREQNPDVMRQIAAKVRRRTGCIQPQYLVLLSVIGLAAVIIVAAVSRAGTLHMTPGDVTAELQPIPADEAAEHDDGCCGGSGRAEGEPGDPREAPVCKATFWYYNRVQKIIVRVSIECDRLRTIPVRERYCHILDYETGPAGYRFDWDARCENITQQPQPEPEGDKQKEKNKVKKTTFVI